MAKKAKAKKPAAKAKVSKKMIYFFGKGKADGNGEMKGIVGWKGSGTR